MSEERFVCMDIGYGDDWYITDNGKRLSEMEIVDLLNGLAEENEQLRGINKEIGDDLYNCRLNKDIVSEKLKLWQDTLSEYDIYTIKDFKELMKNDN